jgi:hypothetical protein
MPARRDPWDHQHPWRCLQTGKAYVLSAMLTVQVRRGGDSYHTPETRLAQGNGIRRPAVESAATQPEIIHAGAGGFPEQTECMRTLKRPPTEWCHATPVQVRDQLAGGFGGWRGGQRKTNCETGYALDLARRIRDESAGTLETIAGEASGQLHCQAARVLLPRRGCRGHWGYQCRRRI